ncbi:MAG: SurA N-terminal domain-containing protein [Sphaerochaetaceae bacterium]|nr:SurA N-terminal domain-containing protein [Sphaerochaetaceae bacterium]
MAEKDEKNLEFKKVSKAGAQGAAVAKKKNANKKSLAWWLGVAVLILISITFVLPAAGIGSLFNDDSTIVFGKYDGKDIEFKYGNFFYNTYYNIVSRMGSNADFNTVFQAWQTAYSQTVVHEALTAEAEKAGIEVTDVAINNAILESGIYNDADGKFDEEAYRSASQTTKDNIYNSVKTQLPAQTVLSDITAVGYSDAEKAFISDMVSTGRSFKYVAFDYSVISDDVVDKYVSENAADFTTVDLQILSVATQEEAEEIMTKLNGGADFATTVQESSIDNFKSNSGNIGPQFAKNLKNYLGLADEDLAKVIAADKDSIVGPVTASTGVAILKVVEAARAYDGDNAELSLAAKHTYAEANPEEAKSAFESAANNFYADAKKMGLEEAAEEAGYLVQSVPATVANPSNSSMLMISFANTDSYGLLTSAAADTAYTTKLYKGETGSVLEPQEANGEFIVTELGKDEDISAISTTLDTYYDYLNRTALQSDVQAGILASDKLEDNFYATFFDKIMSAN